MARCDFCGSTILGRGIEEEDQLFCDEDCYGEGLLLSVAGEIPGDLIAEQIREIHQGSCPLCDGPGPVDVFISFHIWSIVALSSWESRPNICCRSCGVKAKLRAAIFSGFAGWWGIPWGLVMTPVQILRNIVTLLARPDPIRPSERLEELVRSTLAAEIVEASYQEEEGEY